VLRLFPSASPMCRLASARSFVAATRISGFAMPQRIIHGPTVVAKSYLAVCGGSIVSRLRHITAVRPLVAALAMCSWYRSFASTATPRRPAGPPARFRHRTRHPGRVVIDEGGGAALAVDPALQQVRVVRRETARVRWVIPMGEAPAAPMSVRSP
jgi:hypothetical protein